MPLEFEIRLGLEPGQVTAARKLAFVAEHGVGRWRHEKCESVYFDTETLDLWKSGYSLRLRKSGRSMRQTLKSEEDLASRWAERGEWETPLLGPAPEPVPASLLALDLPKDAERLLAQEHLQPAFRVVFSRTRRMMSFAGVEFEIAIDRGTVIVPERKPVHFACIEAEFKSGNRGSFIRAVSELASQLDARIDAMTKATRGFALLLGTPPSRKSSPVSLDDVSTVQRSYAMIAENCLAHFDANVPCAVAGKDDEGIHQARVALRRWRSGLVLLRPALDAEALSLGDDIKWLASSCGPARDWDVFLSDVVDPMLKEFPADKSIAKLREHVVRHRRAAHALAREALLSRRATLLHFDAARQIAGVLDADGGGTDIVAFANEALHRRRRKLRKLGRRLDDLGIEDLHRLRLLAKKARYACEFLGSRFDRKRVRKHVRALARLQEALGGLNDAAVGRRLMGEIRAGLANSRSSHAWLERAETSVFGWLAAISRERIAHLPAAWADYDRLKPFWEKPEQRDHLDQAA